MARLLLIGVQLPQSNLEPLRRRLQVPGVLVFLRSTLPSPGGESSRSHRREGTLVSVTEKEVRKALKGVKDPELNLDLVVLGLVYDIQVEEADVHVMMSLTTPLCPVAPQIIEDATNAVLAVEGVDTCEVELTFDPPWTPERMSPLIRASLGL